MGGRPEIRYVVAPVGTHVTMPPCGHIITESELKSRFPIILQCWLLVLVHSNSILNNRPETAGDFALITVSNV